MLKNKKPHRNLMAWQKTTDLAVEIYRITKSFPDEELYGLTSQLRRAGISGPSNIAEGAAGRTIQQFSNFLSNAVGSLNEIDTQLELALRFGYVTEGDYCLYKLLNECLALTYGLKKSVNSEESAASRRQ